jgi:hypothetical protein
MERTLEEWQRLFPVMETTMTARSWSISLATDKENLKVTLPKEFIDSMFSEWQRLQNHGTPDETVFSRHYTGDWKDSDE